MKIKDLSEKYYLCQIKGEFEDLMDLVGIDRFNRAYRYGFALILNSEILELWGYDGFVPFIDKHVYRVF